MTNELNETPENIITQLDEYPYEVYIRDQLFKFRSWKIKDKKKYLSWTSKISDDNSAELNAEIVFNIRKCLVLDCIEGDTPITPDEYQYLLVAIRTVSVNHIIELTLGCEKCGKEFGFELNLSKAIKTDCEEFKTITIEVEKNDQKLKFKMGRIRSQEVYDNYISKSESEFESLFVDLVMHVHSINGKLLSSEDMFAVFNSIDVDVFENIIKQWEPQRFKTDNNIGVVCKHCNHVEEVMVDDIPGFFPISWTE